MKSVKTMGGGKNDSGGWETIENWGRLELIFFSLDLIVSDILNIFKTLH